jgi:hypothetical protein
MTTLNEVTQAQFDTAEAALISLVRAAYPSLDLRRGTVLRDMLIRPNAAIYGWNSDQLAELQTRMSLVNLAASTSVVPADWANDILANYGVTLNAGSAAIGLVKVIVNGARTYNLSTGFQLTTLSGLIYATTQNYTIKISASTVTGEIELLPIGDGNYYFILPVTAAAVGTQYVITQGTALDDVTTLYGFVSAEAYVDFSGGTSAETLPEALVRLPAAISYRALESRTSIEAKLRNAFEVIRALGIQGYGDPAQLRDKHNPMGFAVGSRVDIYARTFMTPSTIVLTKTATQIGANTFQFTIGRTEAPGYYMIKSISETDSSVSPGSTGVPTMGSYAFTEVREADGLQNTFHDIDPTNGMIETAYSIYQKSTVIVTGVPVATNTHDFKVEVYVAPSLTELQTYVDDTNIRNLEGDYIIRCPLMCLVELTAPVYYKAETPIDVEKMRTDVYNYINGRNFVGRLTRSELASILRDDGAVWVDLAPNGMTLNGVIRDAAGTLIHLSGDALDIQTVYDSQKLVTVDTVVFAAELSSINIVAIPE